MICDTRYNNFVKTTTFSYFLECSEDKDARGQAFAICKSLLSAADSSIKFINAEEIRDSAIKNGFPVFWALYNELTKTFNEQDNSRVIIANFLGTVFSRDYQMSTFERIYLISMLKVINFAVISLEPEDYFRTRLSTVDSDAVLVVDFPVVEFKFNSEYFVDLISKLKNLENEVSDKVSAFYSSIRLYAQVGQFMVPSASKITSETKFVGVPEKYCDNINLSIKDFMRALSDKKFIKAFPDCISAGTLARALFNGKAFIAVGNPLMSSLFKDLPQRKIK